MPRSSLTIAALLGLLYVGFWLWWGGRGEPLGAAETEAYLSRMAEIAARSSHSEPGFREALRELARQDDGNEFYMLNLMKYREKALYPPGTDYGDDVRAAADRYAAAVLPGLLRRGSLPILLARWQGAFLQPEGADVWDEVGIVRYRSRRDLFEFALDLGARDQGIHKWASIEKTHVFPVEPIFDLVFVRGAVAAVLGAVWLALHLALGRVRGRSRGGRREGGRGAGADFG